MKRRIDMGAAVGIEIVELLAAPAFAIGQVSMGAAKAGAELVFAGGFSRVVVVDPRCHHPSGVLQGRGQLFPVGGIEQDGQIYQAHGFPVSDHLLRIWTATAASSTPILPPPFSWMAWRAPSTCRAPASPRSWVTSS